MLQKKHGAAAVTTWQKNNERVLAAAEKYDQAAVRGTANPIYLFDHNVVPCEAIAISKEQVKIPGYEQAITLPTVSDYPDMV
ncbi:MAG: hypothetical protein R3E67_01605 [Pseudomonadales bacterium]